VSVFGIIFSDVNCMMPLHEIKEQLEDADIFPLLGNISRHQQTWQKGSKKPSKEFTTSLSKFLFRANAGYTWSSRAAVQHGNIAGVVDRWLRGRTGRGQSGSADSNGLLETEELDWAGYYNVCEART
jgi:hypothetical protein